MLKISIQDILKTATFSPTGSHSYLYYKGRQVRLFETKAVQIPFKKISALKMLKSLQKQEKELKKLTKEEREALQRFLFRVQAKKQSSGLIRLLSKIQNFLSFQGFLTSAEIADKMLKFLSSKNVTPCQIAIPASISMKKGPLLPEKPLKQFIADYLQNFITDTFSPPETQSTLPLVNELHSAVIKNYPLHNQIDLKKIQELALHVVMRKTITILQTVEKDNFDSILASFSDKIRFHFVLSPSFNLTEEIIRRLKTSQSQKLRKNIKNFVSSFLMPYLQGRITQDNEHLQRQPMLQLLYQHFGKCHHFRRKTGKVIALEAYIIEAVRAMDLYLRNIHYTKHGDVYTPPFKESIIAEILSPLHIALEKDFLLTFKKEQLKLKIHAALINYQQKQIRAFQKAFEEICEIKQQAILNSQLENNIVFTTPLESFRCFIQLLKTPQEMKVFIYEEKYRLILKEGSTYYCALHSQDKMQWDAQFNLPTDLQESPLNPSLRYLGVKFYCDKEGLTYYINTTGKFVQATPNQILRIQTLAESIEQKKECLLFGIDRYAPDLYQEQLGFYKIYQNTLFPKMNF
ncbi:MULTISPECIES: hypothetical protein [Parachlamydia]|uniref:hypothetical protein n=1 Tax=Parachlamydia TaxID=83551 RepID=UPI0001C1732F|nr:hypothetical protein [Parachlamydia acanthamoebae]EFB40124.1 hypothetical protein pah_c260o031 [Parachlamydia acanthamoebae str. Hall's coccus]